MTDRYDRERIDSRDDNDTVGGGSFVLGLLTVSLSSRESMR